MGILKLRKGRWITAELQGLQAGMSRGISANEARIVLFEMLLQISHQIRV